MDYKFGPRHLPFIKEQVWEARGDLSVYNQLSSYEFDIIQSYLPKHPAVITDIGCGLGRMGIFLNHAYQDPSIHYIMADRTGYTGNLGDFLPVEDEFYNDLVLTEDFCKLNGMTNLTTFDTEESDWSSLPKMDLIISVCSFGFHVSIERYLERLLSAASEDCVLIFGTRGYYNADTFKDKFRESIFLPMALKEPFPQENFLILKR